MPMLAENASTRKLRVASVALGFCLSGLIGVCGLSGCVADAASEFQLAQIQRHQQCLADASPIQPALNTARVDVGEVGLFFQTDARLAVGGDTIYLQVYKPDVVQAKIGEPIELADPRLLQVGDESFEEQPIARGMVIFAESCPGVDETFGIVGTVVFEELGTGDGDTVIGTLLDGQIISLRDDSVIAGEITGTWDFTIDLRRPTQYYPADPARFPDELLP